MKIGILAVQGAFAEQRRVLDGLGVGHFEIRQRADLDSPCDGLILPGGESTAIGKLLRDLQLLQPLRERILAGLPVFGVCAGLILLAARNLNREAPHFGTLDITVRRNGYGRQLGSFSALGEVGGIGSFPMVFIRAPRIEEVGPQAEIIATLEGRPVAVRQGNQLVSAFHPELSGDDRLHRLFLDQIVKRS